MMHQPPKSSLGMGFEYRGNPPVPVITVIEPGGPADIAGVKVGDAILSVDGVEVAGIRNDVRDLLVNDRSQITLIVQGEGNLLTSGAWGFIGMGSLRMSEPPRTVIIRRRRDGTSSSSSKAPLDPAAQAAKDRGRKLFQEEKWEQAVQAFSEAIGPRHAADHTLLTNRALCHQKLGRWDEVEKDARRALQMAETSVKAHYLLGRALLEMGRLEEARTELTKSMSLSSSKEFKSYRGSIEQALLSVRKRLWLREQATLDMKDEQARAQLLDAAAACLAAARARGDPPEQAQAAYDRRVQSVNRMVGRARRRHDDHDIPAAMVCRLSKHIMLDPVTTPQGQTYDRPAIERHLADKGPHDPFRSSDAVTKESLVPNLSLKKYIDDYLESNPWAFSE